MNLSTNPGIFSRLAKSMLCSLRGGSSTGQEQASHRSSISQGGNNFSSRPSPCFNPLSLQPRQRRLHKEEEEDHKELRIPELSRLPRFSKVGIKVKATMLTMTSTEATITTHSLRCWPREAQREYTGSKSDCFRADEWAGKETNTYSVIILAIHAIFRC